MTDRQTACVLSDNLLPTWVFSTGLMWHLSTVSRIYLPAKRERQKHMDLWKLKDSLVYIVSVRIALNNREVLSQNKQAKKKKKNLPIKSHFWGIGAVWGGNLPQSCLRFSELFHFLLQTPLFLSLSYTVVRGACVAPHRWTLRIGCTVWTGACLAKYIFLFPIG